MPETVKRLDTFEKLLKECSNIQKTDSLNSDEIMDKIISKADTACTKYTEEVECDSPYFSFL
ncbi:MAG: hypothetical protein CMF55_04580 [Legionellales bacterium]|nr:hypothetical protein [Legionellales bacterium]